MQISSASNGFIERTRQELSRAERYSLFLSIMFIDLSEFSRALGKRKHLSSDAAESLAERLETGLRRTVRDSDVVATFDRNRVGLLLMETSRAGLKVVKDRIEGFIRDYLRGAYQVPFEPTYQIKAASFPEEPDSFGKLTRFAIAERQNA